MSPPSSPEEQERLSNRPMSLSAATTKVPKASNPTQVEAKEIDGSSVLQNQLMCLLDQKEWVNDDIKLPINASNTHWYLAVVNTKKCEVQVLDSLCWNSDIDDLVNTLRGIQFHLDLLKSQNSVSDDWKDIDLTEWKITEQLQKAIQKDSSSCGLFMVKFMEYFTRCALSYPITQEMITSFRFKLASILLCWKTKTAALTTIVEESDDDTKGDPDDVQILESLDDIKNKTKIPIIC
ncbi:hypothetical protein VPH35_015076 [Triticum aestivum]